MRRVLSLITVLAICILSAACNRLGGRSFVPALEGYEMEPGSTLLLKKSLREISGISFRSPGELIAINDELGVAFLLNPLTGDIEKRPFGKKADYEELVYTPEGYYVLESNGNLHLLDADNFSEQQVYYGSFPRYTEFESMVYDPERNQLLLFCKTCGRNADTINAWRFDLRTHSYLEEPAFSIPIRTIRSMGKDDTIECQPSAAGFHPLTRKIYILASIGKVLLECAPNGKLEAVYNINGDLFQQPEAICFAPNGDMYIANEGRQSKASLLFFPYRKPVAITETRQP